MGYDLEKRGKATITKLEGNNTAWSFSRDDRLESVMWMPTKVNGAFTTLPDGSKFRLPTDYQRRYASIQPGSGQLTRSKSGTRTDSIISSSGGWRADQLLTSNCPVFDSSISGVDKLITFPTSPGSMSNEASTKALLKIADQKAGIAEDLATFRQTLGLLKSPCSALLGSLKSAWEDRSVRPYLFKTARDLYREGPLSVGARKYLEWAYGWKPLMSDIYGIIAIMKEKGLRPLLLSGTGHSYQQRQAPQVSSWDGSWNCLNVLGPLDVRSKVTVKLWGRIDPNHGGLRALNQLGLLNPLSLAWELTPWSFVVDWFVPIGPVLQALSAPAGLIFVSGTNSIRTDIKGPYYHHKMDLDSGAIENQPADGTAIHVGYKRSVLNNWPLPGVWINSDPFSGDRSLKALALAITNLRSLK